MFNLATEYIYAASCSWVHCRLLIFLQRSLVSSTFLSKRAPLILLVSMKPEWQWDLWHDRLGVNKGGKLQFSFGRKTFNIGTVLLLETMYKHVPHSLVGCLRKGGGRGCTCGDPWNDCSLVLCTNRPRSVTLHSGWCTHPQFFTVCFIFILHDGFLWPETWFLTISPLHVSISGCRHRCGLQRHLVSVAPLLCCSLILPYTNSSSHWLKMSHPNASASP